MDKQASIGELAEATELLLDALELLPERRVWTRGAFARDQESRPVHPASQRAVRYCLAGALLRLEELRHASEIPVSLESPEEKTGELTWAPPRRLTLATCALAIGCWRVIVRPHAGEQAKREPTEERPETEAAGADAISAWEWVWLLNDRKGVRVGQIREALVVAIDGLGQAVSARIGSRLLAAAPEIAGPASEYAPAREQGKGRPGGRRGERS